MTFRVIIATARGWDHYCADDAMVDAVEAAIGGITFDGAAPARGTDPVFEYKRVAIAWHESDKVSSTDASSSSSSSSRVNSPKSPRNHSDLKPLGLFYIDHTSTVAISELKVCRGQLMKLYQCFHLHTIFPSFLTYVSQIHGENVPVITVTSRAGAGNGGTAVPGQVGRQQFVFAPKSFCSSLTSTEGSINQFHATAQSEDNVKKVRRQANNVLVSVRCVLVFTHPVLLLVICTGTSNVV